MSLFVESLYLRYILFSFPERGTLKDRTKKDGPGTWAAAANSRELAKIYVTNTIT